MVKWSRFLYTPSLPLYGKERITACDRHIEVARLAAEEGLVLLKNDGNILPLDPAKPLALFGKASVEYVKGGGGSGDVFCPYIHSLADGLQLNNVKVFEPLLDYYNKETKAQHDKDVKPGLTTEPELPDDLLKEARGFADTAVIVINRFSGEGWDRSDYAITDAENKLMDKVTNAFDRVIAVINSGGVIDLSRFKEDNKINACLHMWQGGMEGGLAAARALIGLVNPSGKLSDTHARSIDSYPTTKGFHESEEYVEYNEGIYVGYRHFETVPGAREQVVYPFGYGMSYTTFKRECTDSFEDEKLVAFTVKVTNTGKVPGKEVVGLYVKAPAGKIDKPARVLADFAKTPELAPGASCVLNLYSDKYLISSYDEAGAVADACYVLEAGTYEFYLGSNVETAELLSYRMELKDALITSKLTHKGGPKPGVNKDDCAFDKLSNDEMDGFSPIVREVPRKLCWAEKKVKTLSDVAEGKCTMDEFVAQLSDDDLISLTGGQPITGVSNVWGFGNLPDYGIPNVQCADGPAGIRIRPETGVTTTAFPCSTMLCCTWNRDIARAVGFAAGEELKENNLGVWLAPAVNIHRNPLCGRNFEYYSEDPYLAGKMAAALVEGVQNNHVGTSVKHFCCNNKETNRKNSDSRVSERALREVYLKAFEIVVKEAKPYTIMSSYNVVNGHRASENKDTLTGILRDEWGFEGFVMSDWWNFAEQYKEILAGNDLKMPCGFPERVKEALEMGVITRADIERSVKRILGIILKLD
ncbi:MAG: glycoside hydrolase family 3 C-terminal domain-containing protein [Lachnospiraceae bacterium]|nr:glycoside hydrolase family 3 C-terminal domain-containing protein [Lachnospiraceae bacterium]